MEVTFFRHGIAVDRADPLAPIDFERPLTLDGKNKAESAARGLHAIGLRPGLILTSPFKRCVQSARLVAQVLGINKKSVVELEALSPTADPHALWPELALSGRESILCVGHGGAIEPAAGVALGFIGEPDAVFRTLHVKKAGALQLDVSFEPVLAARLTWLMSPKLLRQLGRTV